MSGLRFVAGTGPVAIPAAAASAVIGQLIAPANQRVRIRSIVATLNGTGTADPGVLVKLTRSSAGTGALSGGRVSKLNTSDAETVQSQFGTTWATSQPAAGTVVCEFYVSPAGGLIRSFPPPEEIEVKGGDWLAIEVTTGATVTGSPSIAVDLGGEE